VAAKQGFDLGFRAMAATGLGARPIYGTINRKG
jgi:hypothetical protein